MNSNELALAEKLFAVFVMLRDSNQFLESGTAKMLQEKDAEFFRKRAAEEFAELTGVVDGSHRHSDDFEQDFLLESSQVFYWLSLAAVVQQKNFSEFTKIFARELSELEAIHTANKIPIAKIFEKDLAECEKKGYLKN
ncbi:MAG: hypothetical protein WCV72_00705 [Patescibacteria group bacterium]